MKVQQKISSYLNGEYYSLRRFRDKPISFLKGKIIEITKEDKFISFEKSYDSVYEKGPVVKTVIKKDIKRLKYESKEKGFLRPVYEFQRYIKQYFSKDDMLGAYIHGSLGTMDYIEGYSDFDALLIFKKNIFNNDKKIESIRKKIKKANTFLYLLDPLQHHTLFIISELDMKYYFEPIFPVVLLDYALEITPGWNNKLVFRCLEAESQLRKVFRKRYRYYQKWKEKKYMNAYDIKNAVQSILILPTLYLQAKTGKYLYKKFTFDKAKKDFNEKTWKIIEKATKVRENCSYESYYPYWLRKFIGINFHYKYLHLLHKYFDRNNSKCMLEIMGKNFLQESLTLVEIMQKNLKVIYNDKRQIN